MLRIRSLTNINGRRPLYWLLLPLLISRAAADTAKIQASTAASEEALQAYLDRSFPASITKVSVNKDQIRIEGQAGANHNGLYLADIPMDLLLDDPQSWQSLVEVKSGGDGSFKIDVPRHRQRGGLDYDRLTSRWQLVSKAGAGFEPLSKGRYAEWVTCRAPKLPAAPLTRRASVAGTLGCCLTNSRNSAFPPSQ